MSARTRTSQRRRRHLRVRKKVHGTSTRPRMAVYRSNAHISAQIIDDETGRTLVSASTYEPDLRASSTGNVDAATKVGQLLAERAKASGIDSVVFDRGGFKFHGRVAAVASAAREEGLEF